MDETTLDDNKSNEAAQILPFHVVAVPQINISQLLNTIDTIPTPVNIKIKVKNKKDIVQRLGVTVPKFHTTGTKKIHLVSSDQTIASFDLFMETENEKKISKKHHYKFLNLFKSSGCLNNPKKDDINPYIPSSSNEKYRTKSVSNVNDLQENKTPKENFALKKHLLPISSADIIIKTPTFLGKCKPGGCLDPPFSEDNYIYKPKTLAQEQNNIERHGLEETYLRNANNIAKVVEKSNTVLQDSTSQSLIKNSYSHSLITYPPTLVPSKFPVQETIQNKTSKLKTSFESKARISVNEFTDTYFMPKKRKSKDKENYTVKTYDSTSISKTNLLNNQNKPVLSTKHDKYDNNSNATAGEIVSSNNSDENFRELNLVEDAVDKKLNKYPSANIETLANSEDSDSERKSGVCVLTTDLDRYSNTTLLYENTIKIKNVPSISKDSNQTKYERSSKENLHKSKLMPNKPTDTYSLINQKQNILKLSLGHGASNNLEISAAESKSKEDIHKLTLMRNAITDNDSLTNQEQKKLKSPVASLISKVSALSILERNSQINLSESKVMTNKSQDNYFLTNQNQNKLISPKASIITKDSLLSALESNFQESSSKSKLKSNKSKSNYSLISLERKKSKSSTIRVHAISEESQISTLESKSQENFYKLKVKRIKTNDKKLLASQEQIKFKPPKEDQSLRSNILNNYETKEKFKPQVSPNDVILLSSINTSNEHLPQTDTQVCINESPKLYYSDNQLVQYKVSGRLSVKEQIKDSKEITDIQQKDIQQNRLDFKTAITPNDGDFITDDVDKMINKDNNQDLTLMLSEAADNKRSDSLESNQIFTLCSSTELTRTNSMEEKNNEPSLVANYASNNINFKSETQSEPQLKEKISSTLQLQEKDNNSHTYSDYSYSLATNQLENVTFSSPTKSPLMMSGITSSKQESKINDNFALHAFSYENNISTSQTLNMGSSLNLGLTLEKTSSMSHTEEVNINKMDVAALSFNILDKFKASGNLQGHNPDDTIQNLIEIVPTETQSLRLFESKNDHTLSNEYNLIEQKESNNNGNSDIQAQSQINNSKVVAIVSNNEMARSDSSHASPFSNKVSDQSETISKNYHKNYKKSFDTIIHPKFHEATIKENSTHDNTMDVTECKEKNYLRKNSSFININLGFHTYVNNNNEILIKSFNTSEHLETDTQDKQITIIKSIIRKNDSGITIPINSDINLSMQINKTLDNGNSSQQHIPNILKQSYIDGSTKLSHEDNQLQETLSSVYENLVPVESMIRNLKQEADFLTQQQMLLREILITMNKTSTDIMKTNNKCTCNKYL